MGGAKPAAAPAAAAAAAVTRTGTTTKNADPYSGMSWGARRELGLPVSDDDDDVDEEEEEEEAISTDGMYSMSSWTGTRARSG